MVFPNEHQLLTISGALFGGADRWSIGMRFSNFTAPGTPPQSRVDACEAPIRTWFSSTSSFIAANHSVDLIKLAPIGVDGKYPPDQTSVQKVPTTPINGGGTGGSWPPQCSAAISLTTGFPRGRAHIGRVYPPPLRATLIPNPGLTTSDVNSFLGTFRTMILALNAISGMGSLSVMSKVGAGRSAPVTGFRGGVVIDTQRRRRSAIPENYQLLAL